MLLTCYLVNPAETILLELVQSLSKVREGWEQGSTKSSFNSPRPAMSYAQSLVSSRLVVLQHERMRKTKEELLLVAQRLAPPLGPWAIFEPHAH